MGFEGRHGVFPTLVRRDTRAARKADCEDARSKRTSGMMSGDHLKPSRSMNSTLNRVSHRRCNGIERDYSLSWSLRLTGVTTRNRRSGGLGPHARSGAAVTNASGRTGSVSSPSASACLCRWTTDAWASGTGRAAAQPCGHT